MRCFIAIPLPESVINEFISIQDELKSSGTKMKLVERENLHITIRFYGEIDEKRAEIIKQKMDALNRQSFRIVFDRIDGFPNKQFVRVVWVGVSDGEEELRKIGEHFGNNDLIPHVTLARIKAKPTEKLKEVFNKRLNVDMTAKRILLMQSVLSNKGPRYEVLYEKQFG